MCNGEGFPEKSNVNRGPKGLEKKKSSLPVIGWKNPGERGRKRKLAPSNSWLTLSTMANLNSLIIIIL